MMFPSLDCVSRVYCVAACAGARRAVMFGRWIAADGVFGPVWRLVRVRADTVSSQLEPNRRASLITVNATYGAPEPTHGSPAIMVRMSVRHCVEISSRGDGVRAGLAITLAVLQKAGKRDRGAPSRLLYAVAAPLVHG